MCIVGSWAKGFYFGVCTVYWLYNLVVYYVLDIHGQCFTRDRRCIGETVLGELPELEMNAREESSITEVRDGQGMRGSSLCVARWQYGAVRGTQRDCDSGYLLPGRFNVSTGFGSCAPGLAGEAL